ncbi:HAD-IA family hydrolase [Candidatus Saccharibacteria bacterium]|nr:HAD-IA family hydrolase [Candidatus Saccharibacteria bacterium]
MIILSDLSEVHIRGIRGTERFIAEKFAVSSVGKKGLADKCWRRHAAVNGAFRDLLRGRISEDEYWQEFFAKGQWLFTIDDAKEALSKNLQEVMPHAATGVLQRIIRYPRSLSPDGFGYADGMPTIYLVSDHIANRINEVKAAHPGLFRLFKDEYWSCDAGMIKQDPGFFAAVLDDAGLNPDEVLYIDDDAKNIAAASREGIHGIKFENDRQLETVMRSNYGFEFAPAIP